MESSEAVEALSALASGPRLTVFRLLVRAGPDGLRAGDIAEAIAAPANTASNHLAVLSRSGLIESERHGRSIVYRISRDRVRAMLAFLISDCCDGRPELCGDLSAPMRDAVCP